MVDPSLVDLRSLSDEVRFRIFDYLWGRGVGSSELGVDPTYANKIKNRRAGVSDALLERMLRMLSVDEFAVLVDFYVTDATATCSKGASEPYRGNLSFRTAC